MGVAELEGHIPFWCALAATGQGLKPLSGVWAGFVWVQWWDLNCNMSPGSCHKPGTMSLTQILVWDVEPRNPGEGHGQ